MLSTILNIARKNLKEVVPPSSVSPEATSPHKISGTIFSISLHIKNFCPSYLSIIKTWNLKLINRSSEAQIHFTKNVLTHRVVFVLQTGLPGSTSTSLWMLIELSGCSVTPSLGTGRLVTWQGLGETGRAAKRSCLSSFPGATGLGFQDPPHLHSLSPQHLSQCWTRTWTAHDHSQNINIKINILLPVFRKESIFFLLLWLLPEVDGNLPRIDYLTLRFNGFFIILEIFLNCLIFRKTAFLFLQFTSSLSCSCIQSFHTHISHKSFHI